MKTDKNLGFEVVAGNFAIFAPSLAGAQNQQCEAKTTVLTPVSNKCLPLQLKVIPITLSPRTAFSKCTKTKCESAQVGPSKEISRLWAGVVKDMAPLNPLLNPLKGNYTQTNTYHKMQGSGDKTAAGLRFL